MKELLEHKHNIQRTVLIVDDGFVEREILGAMLSDLYEVVYAENGAAALDVIRSGKYVISIVILDLHMPELDGYSLLKLMCSDWDFKHIPVIVLTSEKGTEVECLQLGAADFIAKPYDAPEVVRARVQHAIQLNENSITIRRTEKDDLTGLFNHDFFFEYGKRMDRHNHIPMDAIVIDVNRFRVLVDLYGRDYGERILKTIADEIQSVLKNIGGIACRSGSNRFYLYVPHAENMNQSVDAYIDVIRQAISDTKVSLRIGIYVDNGNEPDMERKFDHAKFACQYHGNTHETQYWFYDATLHERELYAERLKNDIENALSEKQFQVFYQPQYDVKGDVPVLAGMEALVRWIHPEHGMIGPGAFVPLLEDSGMIYMVDRYVWSEATKQMHAWREKFGWTMPVSINVSRVDFFESLLKGELEGIAKENALPCENIVLEVTESAYTDNREQITDTLNELRKEGFRVEMDDFGSGYSSLNMLTSLPIDALKLDREFVRNISTNQKARRMVDIVAEIAKLLDVPVIAEGIETKEQVEILKSAGCYIMQGYYFSKPLPPEEIETLLKAGETEKE